MNLELKARITEANIETVDYNGFKYNLHKMELTYIKDVYVLTPIFDDISEGDCFVTDNWKVVKHNPGKPLEICVRVQALEVVSPTDFVTSDYLNTKMVGMFLNSDKCFLRPIGPDKVPFYNATLRIKDSRYESMALLIVGFGNNAKKMSTITKQSIVDCEVTVKRRVNAEGYELAVRKISVKSED